MPINIPSGLPSAEALTKENIFVMSEARAVHQDIRPIKILILNLMPKKMETETQLLRMLSNTPLQIDVDLLQVSTHNSKNTPAEYLLKYYNTFSDIRKKRYDGMIVTGAPVEQIEFEDVDYWNELCDIFDWSVSHVYSVFFICWGAQAALYHKYGIGKYPLKEKMFGLFEHKVLVPNHRLLRGYDDVFFAPHSRHTEVRASDIERCDRLQLLSVSDTAGVYIAASVDGREIYVTGHSEYDADTLKNEYLRDRSQGLPIRIPENYFLNDDPDSPPLLKWRGYGSLLYSNWLNYFVYQETPYNLSELED